MKYPAVATELLRTLGELSDALLESSSPNSSPVLYRIHKSLPLILIFN
jgi:hypothetical protein